MSETKQDKWDRGKTLLLESLYKPDSKLRGCAYNQGCYDEMMEIRDQVIELVRHMINPHLPKPKAGEKTNLPPVKSINGISVILLQGSLGKHYMKDWSEEHIKEWEDWKKTNEV